MVAEIDQLADPGVEAVGVIARVIAEADPLGPQALGGRRTDATAADRERAEPPASRDLDHAGGAESLDDAPGQAVNLADEVGDESVGRGFVDALRGIELLDEATCS